MKQNQSAADAGAGGHIDHVTAAPASAVAVFRQGGDVAVVVQNHRYAEARSQIVPHGEVTDIDHSRGHTDIALIEQDEGRHTDADALQIRRSQTVFLEHRPDTFDHQIRKPGTCQRLCQCLHILSPGGNGDFQPSHISHSCSVEAYADFIHCNA